MLPLVNLMFLNHAFAIFIVGILINLFEPYLPSFIVHSFRYGKFAQAGPSVTKVIEIPKSYFKHFYAVAVVIFSITLVGVFYTYYSTFLVPSWVISFLDICCGSDRNISCSPGATLIVLILLTLQCYRRFYETFFIQVFAKTSKMNLLQYFVGHSHYVGCIIAILGHSPGFINSKDGKIENDVIFDVTTVAIAIPTTILFAVAWWKQLQSNQILANLRKDKKSRKVITEKHFVPKGGWFEYVSCPHQLCEILIYIALAPLLGRNSAWFCVILWVLSNQIETSLLSHWWYQKTFSNYPKHRKAIVPYIF